MTPTKEYISRVSLRRITARAGTMQVSIPSSIGRSLLERGYNSAEVYLTDEGILLVPSMENPSRKTTKELPFA